MSSDKKMALSLFFMRVTVFLVMFMWTLDKFIRPGHAIAVYEKFYLIGGLSHMVMLAIAGLEMLLIVAFLLGAMKRLTYGLVFIFHAVSTLSSYKIYMAPFVGPNLLFFAAWPMLAACFALYMLRDKDTMFAVS